MKLVIELVPRPCWYSNMRKVLSKQAWDMLRKQVYAQYEYKCGICQVSARLHCHEQWHYDDERHIQTLTGFIALCEYCHHVKHIGFAGILASRGEVDYGDIVEHFLLVNQCDEQVFLQHKRDAFQQWEERSRYDWKTDLGSYAHLVQKKSASNE